MSAECTSFIIDCSHTLITDNQYDRIIKYLEFTLLEKCKKMRKTDWISMNISNTYDAINDEGIDDFVQLCSCEAPVESQLFQETIQTIMFYNNLDKVREVDEGCHTLTRTMLVTNVQMRQVFGKRKVMKQIMIFSDNFGSLDLMDEELALIMDQLMETRLILVNCSLESSPMKITKETIWGKLIENQRSNGLEPLVVSLDDLMERISISRTPLVKPIRVFTGELRMGATNDTVTSMDRSVHETAFNDPKCLCISVEGYPATKSVSGLNRKLVLKNNEQPTVKDEDKKELESSSSSFKNHLQVKSIVEYEIREHKKTENVRDDIKENHTNKYNTPYTSIPVGIKSIAKAYRYGSDYVVLPPTLLDKIEYKTSPGLDIRGFASRAAIPRQYLMSESIMIIADSVNGNKADAMAYTALVDSMLKNDKVAIARYVNKKMGEVKMVCLVPLVSSTKHTSMYPYNNNPVRMLILSKLPFAEDVRISQFPSLTKPKSTSGKPRIQKDKENESNLDILMGKLIDSMDTDDIPSIDSDIYYRHYSEFNRYGTSLPLPEPNDEIMKMYETDPVMIPSIGLQYQNKVILSWIHQKIIEQSLNITSEIPLEAQNDVNNSEFQAPDFPEALKKQISTYHNVKNVMSQKDKKTLIKLANIQPGEAEQARLTSLQGIKKTGSKTPNFAATKLGPSYEEIVKPK